MPPRAQSICRMTSSFPTSSAGTCSMLLELPGVSMRGVFEELHVVVELEILWIRVDVEVFHLVPDLAICAIRINVLDGVQQLPEVTLRGHVDHARLLHRGRGPMNFCCSFPRTMATTRAPEAKAKVKAFWAFNPGEACASESAVCVYRD